MKNRHTIAHHEAGHVVMMAICGQRVKSAFVGRQSGQATNDIRHYYNPTMPKYILIHLAGIAAEIRRRDISNEMSEALMLVAFDEPYTQQKLSKVDREQLKEIREQIEDHDLVKVFRKLKAWGKDETFEKRYKFYFMTAQHILVHPDVWPRVKRIASILHKSGRITAKHIDPITAPIFGSHMARRRAAKLALQKV